MSNMSISIITQYFKEIKPLPTSGLSGSDNCVYEVSVSKEGGKTFVTLLGKDMNSFGDSNFVGIDGFQQSLLKSLYRSLKDKRDMICEDYKDVLVECGGTVRFLKSLGDKSRTLWERLNPKNEKDKTEK